MKALSLIIQREYLSRIKKKSFVVMTIIMPFLMVALIFVPLILSGIRDSETKHVIIIDNTGHYASHLKCLDGYSFEIMSELNQNVRNKVGKDVFGILQINDDLEINPKAAVFFSEKQVPSELLSYVSQTFSEVIKTDRINALAQERNIATRTIIDIQQLMEQPTNVQITTMRWGNGTEKETSTTLASAIGGFFTFLMYMFILMYGTMVMQGVVEEKSNRIVEVMISSVRPFDLMMGKIIGIGLTGLTQLLIWGCTIGTILGVKFGFFNEMNFSETSDVLSNLNMISSINWVEIVLYFLLLFIGGYLMYASLFAMFGAAVDNAQDTQQFVMPVTIIFLFAFYAGIYSIQNPDGPLAFWCSMIPLTSPIVMMVRIPFEIPLWEKILSIVILYLTIFFVVKFAAKVYRVGILMYGKKPSLREILRWISYK